MKRPINKENKRNIKCEHCQHWSKVNEDQWGNAHCKISGEKKCYYNRCKQFQWNENFPYKEDQ